MMSVILLPPGGGWLVFGGEDHKSKALTLFPLQHHFVGVPLQPAGHLDPGHFRGAIQHGVGGRVPLLIGCFICFYLGVKLKTKH